MGTALIIGAAGQDGRLLAKLLRKRAYEVRGWTRTEPSEGLYCECSHVDLQDAAAVAEEMAKYQPNEIYYLAAFHHATEDPVELDPEELMRRSREIHLLGLHNVLEAMKTQCLTSRLFYAASAHVFGEPGGKTQNEETPFLPTSAYGITKAAGIECCRFYREQGIYAATGILFNHESHLRKPTFVSKKIVTGALQAARDPKHRLVLGDLEARVDWGYAPDYVEAMHRILQLAQADDFVIASGETHPVREFAEIAFRALGLDWRKHVEVDAELLQRKASGLCGDATKLRNATGWAPTMPFEKMVKKLIEQATPPRSSRLLVFIPTYNEAENAERLCRELTELNLGADILFCDDASPDGTGEIIDRLARTLPHVHAMHRDGKLGIGSAHQDGIEYAYAHAYDTLVTMDCDFTHQPADVARLLDIARTTGRAVAVGSRYMERNSLPGWNLVRRSLTHFGHLLTTRLLRLPQDATGALRVYDLRAIPQELWTRVRSRGYSFFFESLYVLHRNSYAIAEMPIALPARTYGTSKMCLRETLRSAVRLLKLFWAGLRQPESFLLSSPILPILAAESPLEDPHGWDAYWTRGQEKSRRFYTLVASLYRRFAIRRSLNHFIRKHFAPGARLLHAGCGSGHVDTEISRAMRITALDISLPALETYRQNNPHAEAIQRGDILHLENMPNESFDGAYNLGVVEHFTQEQIVQILGQMGRIVKRGGKVVIFWPHRRASSVFILKCAHRILDLIRQGGGSQVRLHPPEVSLLESREQARQVIERAGFNLVEYYFGMRDLLVQAVVVGCKR